ncbi:MAG: ABC transporter permease [Bauldia sp.]|mgnify:CR=1 FL=1
MASVTGRFARALLAAVSVLAVWQALTVAFSLPAFILPGPARVAAALAARPAFWSANALTTGLEALVGLVAGSIAGIALAVSMGRFPRLQYLLQPVMVVSQSFPVFALAPLLVLWFGFGFGSKIAMAVIAIFFPVAAALDDGLRATPPHLLDLGRLYRAAPYQELFLLRLPSAVPRLVTGLRLASVYAPIGALVGEWVGASSGLGYVMLQANGRSQTDVVFAALLIVATLAVALRAVVDAVTARLLSWSTDPF